MRASRIARIFFHVFSILFSSESLLLLLLRLFDFFLLLGELVVFARRRAVRE